MHVVRDELDIGVRIERRTERVNLFMAEPRMPDRDRDIAKAMVGSGGGDIAMNLVQLCTSCHIGAHSGSVKRDELLAIVARREGVAYEDAYRVNRRAMGYMVD